MSTTGFLLGGMLGRIAGPIAQDFFKYKTRLGREIASREEDSKRRASLFELENKKKLSDHEHELKLLQLQQQFIDKRKSAEEQMFISRADWQQKLFWEECFPLRNPYELPLGYEPIYQESSERLLGCQLKTVMVENEREIIPLRVITAIAGSNPTATTLNANLSMFLINYFSSNGIHAIVSDIGSWKDKAPINDASINFLYKGTKGQPTMVIMPLFTNGGSTVRIKVWAWGLGENSPYPQGFDFGWFDLEAIRRRINYQEIKNFIKARQDAKMPIPASFDNTVKKIGILEQKETQLNEADFDSLLISLDTPKELASIIDRKTNDVVSTIFSCVAGMYADGYHLSQYATLPLMPNLIGSLDGIEFMLPYIRDYYISLVNAKIYDGILSIEQAASVELTLAREMKRISSSSETYEDIVSDLRRLNSDIDGDSHMRIISAIRELKQNQKLLESK